MQTMTAVVLNKAPGPLSIERIPIPEPRAGEVLVRVRACGVCHTDLHVIKAEVAFPTPAVLGHEISGTVEALGPGVTGPPVGTAVVGSFIMPCGVCRACGAGRDDLCEKFFAMGRGKTRFLVGKWLSLAGFSGRPRLFRPEMSGLSTSDEQGDDRNRWDSKNW